MADNTISVLIRAKDLASREFQKLERNIDNLKKNNTSLANSTTQVSSGMNMLGKAAGAAGAAFAAMELGRFAIDLGNIGEEVRNAQNRFRDLAGGVDNAEASLERMRGLTRNIADDASLVAGASDLLLMGIAKSTFEAEKIVELAVGLKRSTDTVADAINNFSIMLGNQAYLRLDSFGISAGRVRLRVEELLETGQALTREDAFTMAVLEIGAQTMDRTSDSIDEASTSFKRLKTDVINAGDAIGLFTEQALEGIAAFTEFGLLATGIGGLFGMDAGRLDDMQDRFVEENLRRTREGITELTTGQRKILAEAGLRGSGLDAVFSALQGTSPQYGGLFDGNIFGGGGSLLQNQIAQSGFELNDFIAEYGETFATLERVTGVTIDEIINDWDRYRDAILEGAAGTERTLSSLAFQTRYLQIEQAKSLRDYGIAQQSFNTANESFLQNMSKGQIGDTFFDPDYLQYAATSLEGMRVNYEALVASGLASEGQIEAVEEMLKANEKAYRQAEQAANAWANVSLSQLMGETGDRSTQELADLIAQGIFNPEQAEGFTRSVERLTGARTAITDYIESELAPITQALIARYGEEMGAQFAFNINQALEQGAMMGLDPQTMVNQIKQNLGVTMSETDAITVHIPAMATWSNIYGDTRPLDEDGNPLTDEALADKIEADLNLADGTVDLNRPILYAIQGTGLTAQSLANLEGVRSDLLDVIFNDSQAPTLDLGAALEVNLPNVGIGRIMAMTGFTKQEIMQQLAAQGEDFHYDPATDRLYVNPGTFTFMPYRQVPITEADFSLSSSAMRESAVFQESFDPFANLLPNSQLLLQNMQNFGTVDLSATQTQLDSADTTVTSIYDTTKLLTETVWTLTINVEVIEPELDLWLQKGLERLNQDNGGRSPGTIYNPVNGRD